MTTEEQSEKKSIEEIKQEPYNLMDRWDEDQIIAELEGNYLKGMVYQFEQTLPDGGKQKVTGLSYMGIKECAHQFSKISGEPIDVVEDIVTETNEAITVRIKARHPTIGSRVGIAVQNKHWSSGRVDERAIIKAYSKAQRNAFRQLLPELTIQAFIDKALEKGDIKEGRGAEHSGGVIGFTGPAKDLADEIKSITGWDDARVQKELEDLRAQARYSELGALKKTLKDNKAPVEPTPSRPKTEVPEKKPAKKPQVKAKPEPNTKQVKVDVVRYKSGTVWKAEDIGALLPADKPMHNEIFDAILSKDPLNDDTYGISELWLKYYKDEVVLVMEPYPNNHWALYNKGLKEVGYQWCSAGKSSHWFKDGGIPIPEGGDIEVPDPKDVPEHVPEPQKEESSNIDDASADEIEPPETITIQSKDGTELGKLTYHWTQVGKLQANAVFVSSMPFKVQDDNVWDNFFIKRILDQRVVNDNERIKTGDLKMDRQLTYEMSMDDDSNLKVLRIENIGYLRQRREIESALRWTIEKLVDA